MKDLRQRMDHQYMVDPALGERAYWNVVEILFIAEMKGLVAELERLGVEYGQELG